jgi:hypothetical protein
VHNEEALMSRVLKFITGGATGASALWLVGFLVRFGAGSSTLGVIDGIFILLNAVLFLIYYRDAEKNPRVPRASRERWRIVVFLGGGITQSIYFVRFVV